jgi:CubicO group peptidase (beta-lactamase class C family)
VLHWPTGSLPSLDIPVVRYLQLAARPERVTVRHLLTMSSGVRWTEVYPDRDSDVNRYSRSLANQVPGGVFEIMRALPAAHAPGAVWCYNSGDTYLLGAVISAATGRRLADYMAERIWQPAGMEFDAFYTIESPDGQEIGGSRAGMALRDFGRFAQMVADDGVVDGRRCYGRLVDGWRGHLCAAGRDAGAAGGAGAAPGQLWLQLVAEHRRRDRAQILQAVLYIHRERRLVVVWQHSTRRMPAHRPRSRAEFMRFVDAIARCPS